MTKGVRSHKDSRHIEVTSLGMRAEARKGHLRTLTSHSLTLHSVMSVEMASPEVTFPTLTTAAVNKSKERSYAWKLIQQDLFLQV